MNDKEKARAELALGLSGLYNDVVILSRQIALTKEETMKLLEIFLLQEILKQQMMRQVRNPVK